MKGRSVDKEHSGMGFNERDPQEKSAEGSRSLRPPYYCRHEYNLLLMALEPEADIEDDN